MAFTELGDERSSKHALQLGGIECTGVLSGSFERMESRIEVSGLLYDARTGGLMRSR